MVQKNFISGLITKESMKRFNEVTKYFAELSKHVDKFHFKNHTDTWCQKECNPCYVSKREGVNSSICGQLKKISIMEKGLKSYLSP